MVRMRLVVPFGLLALSAAFVAPVRAAEPTVTKFEMMNHPQMKLPEQDVFIESADDPTMVMRLEGAAASDAANLAKDAYASTKAVPHDPFKVGTNPLGPYPKGAALGFTLGKWLGAKASGTYTVNGDTASLEVTASGLVPNATYTVWCSRLKFPPDPQITDYPCGAADGSENVAKTDASGALTYSVNLKPLAPSTAEVANAIALAYHSDAKSHGASPGDFGLNSHVQLVYAMPAPAEAAPAATATMPQSLPATGGGERSSLAWIVAAAAALLGLGIAARRSSAAA